MVRPDKYSGQPLVELFKDGVKERLALWNVGFDALEDRHKIINQAEVWVMQAAKSK